MSLAMECRYETSFRSTALSQIRRISIACGVFDGVHLGHQKVIAALLRIARETNSEPVALTFDPHPRTLFGKEPISLLVPLNFRALLLRECGVKEVVVRQFDREFAAQEPELFLRSLLRLPHLELAGFCVGSSWRFGAGGRGNAALIREFARRGGVYFEAVPELEIDGGVVSSTRIRELLRKDDLDGAARLFGRCVSLFGTVRRGYQLATAELETPTANLECGVELPIRDGVYAARAYFQDRWYRAAVNIGWAPTFHYAHPQRRVEVHLLGCKAELYDKYLRVELLGFLREEKKFQTVRELKNQIDCDLEAIRAACIPFFEEKERI